MQERLAVVIPALDEEARIEAAIDSARRAGADEIVVADGGSGDATVRIAGACGADVLAVPGSRGRQLNEGAARTTAEILLFLHADTVLPGDALERIREVMAKGADFGGFRIRFIERSMRLRLAEMMINLRSSLTHCPWGDQAQFIRRSVFDATGGFREIAIMEDYEMAIRMKRRRRSALVDSAVLTSGRRFLEKGLLRTAWINWRIVAAWRLGKDPEALAKIYRG